MLKWQISTINVQWNPISRTLQLLSTACRLEGKIMIAKYAYLQLKSERESNPGMPLLISLQRHLLF